MDKDPKPPQPSPQAAAHQPPQTTAEPKGATQEQSKALTAQEQKQQRFQHAQGEYLKRTRAAWQTYQEKTAGALEAHQKSLREIHVAAAKAAEALHAPPDDGPLDQRHKLSQEARQKTIHIHYDTLKNVREAERKYQERLTFSWYDVWGEVADAVRDFWDFVTSWWDEDEPPVEGAYPARLLADPGWRPEGEYGGGHPGPYAMPGWGYAARLY